MMRLKFGLNIVESVQVVGNIMYCSFKNIYDLADVGACGDHAAMYQFPLVAGHEGVGEVVQVGPKASSVRVGDKVGLGVYRGSCSTCDSCSKGWDNVCTSRMLMFRGGNSGAFARYVRINHRYAFKLPDALPLTHAGPLMCAGTTVFAPFIEHEIPATARVGVVGIGGLGHLALQFANRFDLILSVSSFLDGDAMSLHFPLHYQKSRRRENLELMSLSLLRSLKKLLSLLVKIISEVF
jgi:alcohol/geraniol dehydrogenase (NADP+)